MSLAFAHDEIISAPLSTRRTTARKATADLVFIIAFVALSIVAILVVATQPSTLDTDRTVAAVSQL